jgi:hypothetical protein
MSGGARPDFFLVGAPKCGTTAMADYLGQHPELGMCPRKETHHFGSDLHQRLAQRRGQHPPDLDEYLALFEGLEGYRRRGEASVWYLYSEAGAAEIKAFEPEASIIVMLRDPVEMVPSLHSEFVYVGIEPVEDLAAALALDAERERSGAPRGFPPSSYRDAASYAKQLERYLSVFGRDRVHVILYDDFRRDTPAVVRGAFEFLGVDPTFVPDLEIVNPNKQVRSRLMRRVVRRPPEPVRRLLHRVTSQRARRLAGRALNSWNTRFVRRAPPPQSVAGELGPLADEQALELRELIGADLESWRRS